VKGYFGFAQQAVEFDFQPLTGKLAANEIDLDADAFLTVFCGRQ
jgi:hypothetical protein